MTKLKDECHNNKNKTLVLNYYNILTFLKRSLCILCYVPAYSWCT